MITNTHRKQRSKTSGFSLVEMLSVVGVIGVISAIAIPSVTNTNDASRLAATKRNAQNVVSVYQSAQSAGLIFLDDSGDLEKTVRKVVEGGLVPDGVFEGTFFGLPELSEADIKLAMEYIDFRNNGLEYFSQGVDENERVSIEAPDPVVAGGNAPLPPVAVADPTEVFEPLVVPPPTGTGATSSIAVPGSNSSTQTFNVADPSKQGDTETLIQSIDSSSAPIYYTPPSANENKNGNQSSITPQPSVSRGTTVADRNQTAAGNNRNGRTQAQRGWYNRQNWNRGQNTRNNRYQLSTPSFYTAPSRSNRSGGNSRWWR